MNKSKALGTRLQSNRNFLGHQSHPVKKTTARFWLLATGVFILSALSWSAIAPVAVESARNYAAYAADRGKSIASADARRSIAYYQVASLLDTDNQQYSQLLSDAYLNQGMVSKALSALGQTKGQEDQAAKLLLKLDRPDEAVTLLQAKVQNAPSGQSYLLLGRAYIEKASYKDAETAATRAEEYESVRDNAILLGVIAARLQGQQDIPHASVSSQEALRLIAAAKAGQTPLAQVLYELGLLRASQRVLESLSVPSAVSYQLRAQLKLAQNPPSSQNLIEASEFLKQAITIAPQNIALHRQLAEVLTAMGKQELAKDQVDRVKLLEKGTP